MCFHISVQVSISVLNNYWENDFSRRKVDISILCRAFLQNQAALTRVVHAQTGIVFRVDMRNMAWLNLGIQSSGILANGDQSQMFTLPSFPLRFL